MKEKRPCPGCRKPLAPNVQDGLCPACLMKAGLGTGVDIRPDSQGENVRTPSYIFRGTSDSKPASVLPVAAPASSSSWFCVTAANCKRPFTRALLPAFATSFAHVFLSNTVPQNLRNPQQIARVHLVGFGRENHCKNMANGSILRVVQEQCVEVVDLLLILRSREQ